MVDRGLGTRLQLCPGHPQDIEWSPQRATNDPHNVNTRIFIDRENSVPEYVPFTEFRGTPEVAGQV